VFEGAGEDLNVQVMPSGEVATWFVDDMATNCS
jgi:hypothetical protein